MFCFSSLFVQSAGEIPQRSWFLYKACQFVLGQVAQCVHGATGVNTKSNSIKLPSWNSLYPREPSPNIKIYLSVMMTCCQILFPVFRIVYVNCFAKLKQINIGFKATDSPAGLDGGLGISSWLWKARLVWKQKTSYIKFYSFINIPNFFINWSLCMESYTPCSSSETHNIVMYFYKHASWFTRNDQKIRIQKNSFYSLFL